MSMNNILIYCETLKVLNFIVDQTVEIINLQSLSLPIRQNQDLKYLSDDQPEDSFNDQLCKKPLHDQPKVEEPLEDHQIIEDSLDGQQEVENSLNGQTEVKETLEDELTKESLNDQLEVENSLHDKLCKELLCDEPEVKDKFEDHLNKESLNDHQIIEDSLDEQPEVGNSLHDQPEVKEPLNDQPICLLHSFVEPLRIKAVVKFSEPYFRPWNDQPGIEERLEDQTIKEPLTDQSDVEEPLEDQNYILNSFVEPLRIQEVVKFSEPYFRPWNDQPENEESLEDHLTRKEFTKLQPHIQLSKKSKKLKRLNQNNSSILHVKLNQKNMQISLSLFKLDYSNAIINRIKSSVNQFSQPPPEILNGLLIKLKEFKTLHWTLMIKPTMHVSKIFRFNIIQYFWYCHVIMKLFHKIKIKSLPNKKKKPKRFNLRPCKFLLNLQSISRVSVFDLNRLIIISDWFKNWTLMQIQPELLNPICDQPEKSTTVEKMDRNFNKKVQIKQNRITNYFSVTPKAAQLPDFAMPKRVEFNDISCTQHFNSETLDKYYTFQLMEPTQVETDEHEETIGPIQMETDEHEETIEPLYVESSYNNPIENEQIYSSHSKQYENFDFNESLNESSQEISSNQQILTNCQSLDSILIDHQEIEDTPTQLLDYENLQISGDLEIMSQADPVSPIHEASKFVKQIASKNLKDLEIISQTEPVSPIHETPKFVEPIAPKSPSSIYIQFKPVKYEQTVPSVVSFFSNIDYSQAMPQDLSRFKMENRTQNSQVNDSAESVGVRRPPKRRVFMKHGLSKAQSIRKSLHSKFIKK